LELIRCTDRAKTRSGSADSPIEGCNTVMLEKEDILRGLTKLDAKAREAGVIVDLSIYGGAAVAIAFDVRRATRDVDAVVRGNPDFVRRAAAQIAEEEGWPVDWLNDGVKGFTSSNEKMQLMAGFEASVAGGLRIHTPTPEYLFAMKCMAMRPEGIDGSHDISDIEALAIAAGIKSVEEALSLVSSFYPASRIPPKVEFGVQEIMEKLEDGAGSRPGRAAQTPRAAKKSRS
jgi:hypothetical protein